MWYCVELDKIFYSNVMAYILQGVGCTVFKIAV